jgi:hypothetical protein
MCKSMNMRMCSGDQPKDWLNKAETQRGIESSKYAVEVLSHHDEYLWALTRGTLVSFYLY